MDLLPSDEQQQIIDSMRDFFASEFSLMRLRPDRMADDDGGRQHWPAIGELGFFGLGLPETLGGVGCSQIEEALLMREAGRYLLSPCLLANLLAARVASGSGDMQLTQALISGQVRVALMLPLGDAIVGKRLLGKFQLFDAEGADVLLAWNAKSAALLRSAALKEISDAGTIDEAVSIARVQVDTEALATVSAEQDSIGARAVLLLAAQLVGLAEGARDMAAEFSKMREQFGQPIGAFQAIKHRCADMAVRAESAWFQTVFAAIGSRDGLVDAPVQIAAALVLASTAAHENSMANVQVHGGMGYTAECDAHHYVKRARILEHLAGGMRRHQRTLLQRKA